MAERRRPAAAQDVEQAVQRVIRPEIRELAAYPVAHQEGLIKLDAMENPYAWPEEMVSEWLGRLRATPMNRYPGPAPGLEARLRERCGIPDDLRILLGNGSDEIIQMLILAAAGTGRTVLSTDPCFAMYRLVSRMVASDFVAVALAPQDFSLRRDAMLAALERHAPSLVFLAYPNNPTGNLFDPEVIEDIIAAAAGLVVLDEAYEPFARASFVERIAEHPNLVVVRTLSKLGLAGLRIGYLVADPAWVREVDKVRAPYNVNVLTQASAEFALEHYQVLRDQTDAILAERRRLHAALGTMPGVEVWSSEANFLLMRVSPGSAGGVCRGLRERGVLVRNFDGSSPLLADCIRVSVGRPEENDAFLSALAEVLRS